MLKEERQDSGSRAQARNIAVLLRRKDTRTILELMNSHDSTDPSKQKHAAAAIIYPCCPTVPRSQESRRWILTPDDRLSAQTFLCMDVSFFSNRCDVPRGVSI
jgi:hypothetical protein